MGRSVSTPNDTINVAYATCDGDEWDWRDAVENMQGVAQYRYKSLSRCNEWIGREDRAVLENDHCYIGVSEYCGLVSVWIVAKGADRYSDPSGLATHWCSSVDLQPLAECFGPRLISRGTFSNGEQFFAPADGVQRGDMGLGFTSKEGWL